MAWLSTYLTQKTIEGNFLSMAILDQMLISSWLLVSSGHNDRLYVMYISDDSTEYGHIRDLHELPCGAIIGEVPLM